VLEKTEHERLQPQERQQDNRREGKILHHQP
jgi:hypothetical protein